MIILFGLNITERIKNNQHRLINKKKTQMISLSFYHQLKPHMVFISDVHIHGQTQIFITKIRLDGVCRWGWNLIRIHK